MISKPNKEQYFAQQYKFTPPFLPITPVIKSIYQITLQLAHLTD